MTRYAIISGSVPRFVNIGRCKMSWRSSTQKAALVLVSSIPIAGALWLADVTMNHMIERNQFHVSVNMAPVVMSLILLTLTVVFATYYVFSNSLLASSGHDLGGVGSIIFDKIRSPRLISSVISSTFLITLVSWLTVFMRSQGDSGLSESYGMGMVSIAALIGAVTGMSQAYSSHRLFYVRGTTEEALAAEKADRGVFRKFGQNIGVLSSENTLFGSFLIGIAITALFMTTLATMQATFEVTGTSMIVGSLALMGMILGVANFTVFLSMKHRKRGTTSVGFLEKEEATEGEYAQG